MRALNDYEGAVILISHDRHLIEACADRLWIVRDGTVRPTTATWTSYRAECLAERGADPDAPRAKAKANGAAQADGAGRAPAGGGAARRAGAAAGRTSPRPRPRSSCCPSASPRSTATLADGGLYRRDPARAQALARERGGLIRARAGRRGRLARRQRGLRAGRGAGQGKPCVALGATELASARSTILPPGIAIWLLVARRPVRLLACA